MRSAASMAGVMMRVAAPAPTTHDSESATLPELRELKRLLEEAQPSGTAYVMFNNLPRVGDAKRFLRL